MSELISIIRGECSFGRYIDKPEGHRYLSSYKCYYDGKHRSWWIFNIAIQVDY